MQYRLSNADMLLVAQVGALRNIRGLSHGYPDRAGFQNTEGQGWALHIEGAAGEFIVARYLGMYWGIELNNFRDGDLDGIDIKTSAHDTGRLIVKPGDSPDLIFVLVIGKIPLFRIAGWAYGHEVLQNKYLTKLAPNSPEAYAMPQKDLHSIIGLKHIVIRQSLAKMDREEDAYDSRYVAS